MLAAELPGYIVTISCREFAYCVRESLRKDNVRFEEMLATLSSRSRDIVKMEWRGVMGKDGVAAAADDDDDDDCSGGGGGGDIW